MIRDIAIAGIILALLLLVLASFVVDERRLRRARRELEGTLRRLDQIPEHRLRQQILRYQNEEDRDD